MWTVSNTSLVYQYGAPRWRAMVRLARQRAGWFRDLACKRRGWTLAGAVIGSVAWSVSIPRLERRRRHPWDGAALSSWLAKAARHVRIAEIQGKCACRGGLAASARGDETTERQRHVDPSRVTFDAAPDARMRAIVDAPIAWNDERERLTLEYRRAHSDSAATDLTITPRAIVLHYSGIGSARATRDSFDAARIDARRAVLARAGAVNVSAHFLVDRDGTIYRLQPETRFARHCIGLNHLAIGIENVGDDAKVPLTDAQVIADAALIRDLTARFPITHVLGHSEVREFQDHPYFLERDPTYRTIKRDPGAQFMSRVRALIDDLKLAGPTRQ